MSLIAACCEDKWGLWWNRLVRDVFEVEFLDNDGRTYAMLLLKSSQLLVLHYQPA